MQLVSAKSTPVMATLTVAHSDESITPQVWMHASFEKADDEEQEQEHEQEGQEEAKQSQPSLEEQSNSSGKPGNATKEMASGKECVTVIVDYSSLKMKARHRCPCRQRR